MKDKNIKTVFAKYISFNILGMLGLSCYILADTFFIARGIGSDGLTALNIAIPVYSFIKGTGIMIGMGGATRFSISKSKNIFTESLCYGLIAAILFFTVGVFFSEQLSILLGADKVILLKTSIYVKVVLYFAPAFLLNNIMICFVRNDNNPNLSMIAMLAGSISNIILDYVFIFQFGMGMFGAAVATGIAPVISLMVLSVHFIKKKNTFTILKSKIKIKSIMDITSLGVSSLITEVSAGTVIIIFNNTILKLAGNLGVAAYGIIANIALVIISIFTGVSQGIQPILSKCYGEKNKESLICIQKYGFITSGTIAIIIYLVIIVFADPIIAIFNKDSNLYLASIAKNGFYIYFTAFLLAGFNDLCSTYFYSTDNPKMAFIISFGRGFAVVIPVIFALAALFGINGVWMSTPCTELIMFVVALNMLKNNIKP